MSKTVAKGLGLILGLGIGVSAWASPTCPTGITFNFDQSVQFGDGFSQSLPLSGLNVASTPGQISDCLVVATGPNGGPVTNNQNAGAIDNAYETPNGSDANAWFRTGDPKWSPDPQQPGPPGFSPDFTGDRATSWDIRVSALSAYLNGNAMLFYFNHNQTNSGGALDQDLFVWAQIVVRAADGTTVKAVFDFNSMVNSVLSNFGCIPGQPVAGCVFTADGSNYTSPGVASSTFPTNAAGAGFPKLSDFARARGRICSDGTNVVSCDDPTATTSTDTNLGADHVANAIFFPELQRLLNGETLGGFTIAADDVLSIDLRMGCNAAVTDPINSCPAGSVLNNGYEQLFIVQAPQQGRCPPGSTDPICTPDLPEPGTLALIGLAAIGLAATRRKLVRKGEASTV